MAEQTRKWRNSRGTEVRLKPIPPMLLDGISSDVANDPEWGARPTPPTYTEEATGEVFPHNETTLETEEDKAQWTEYELNLARWDGEVTRRTLLLITIDGIEVDASAFGPGSRWEKKMLRLGKRPSEDEFERHIEYVNSEILVTAEDFADIMFIVMEMTGVDRGTLAKANAMFRSKLQGREVSGQPDTGRELEVSESNGSTAIQLA